MRLSVAVLLALAPLPAQRQPEPTAEAIVAAKAQIVDALTDLWADASAGDAEPIVQQLIDASMHAKGAAERYALLRQALRCATRTGCHAAAEAAVAEIVAHFAVDAGSVRLDAFEQFAAARSIPDLAIAQGLLDIAASEPAQAARAERAFAAFAAENADLLALRQRWSRQRSEIEAARREAEAAGTAAARGRLLCYFEDRWTDGLPLLGDGTEALGRLVRAKAEPVPDGPTCLRVAESWLDRARNETATVAQRNLRRRAALWYRHAWLAFDGLERERVAQHLDKLEDSLSADDRLARATALADFVIQGGEWSVAPDGVHGRNTGLATRATHRYAWQSIDAVTIRGGIVSVDNLNFRIAVGPLNILFNWEVTPENHFYIGDQRVATTQPPALQRGREHVIRIRQLGPQIVVFVDGAVVFAGNGELTGTVAVYPAIGSEILVREVAIVGEIAPLLRVGGPLSACR